MVSTLQAGVNADAISKEDLLNAPGETYSVKLTTAGSYSYFCEPHQGGLQAARCHEQQAPMIGCSQQHRPG
jgi:plastocyanin